MTKYKITYYTNPGSTITRQHSMASSLISAEAIAVTRYERHRDMGPVNVWARDKHGDWTVIATDEDVTRWT